MVCGTPGEKTNAMLENTKAAASQIGFEEEIILESNPKEMGKYGILDSPAIVVYGKLMSEGKLLSVEEITKILESA